MEIHVEDRGPVRLLTLASPGRRNAVPAEAWSRLAAAFDAFEEGAARSLVITGAGGDFCSGADLSAERPAGSAADRYAQMGEVAAAASALRRLSKPTVAAVDGVAVGAGMNLALGCDVVLATPSARFSEIFVRRGLTIDFGGTWLLPRLVGLARAKELALTGAIISGAEAADLGLVSRTVEAGGLLDEALAVARDLAAGAPLAQRFIKIGLERSFGMTFDEALAYEGQAQAVCLMSEDVVEGVAAFLQKRAPEFRGR